MWPRIDGLRTMEFGHPGALRRELNDLVLAGTKRATAGLLTEYARESEDLEHAGERLVVIDDEGAEIGRIVIEDVEVVPFADVPYAFAVAEGEGFTSIDHWRSVHLDYWAAEGKVVGPGTDIALIFFRLD